MNGLKLKVELKLKIEAILPRLIKPRLLLRLLLTLLCIPSLLFIFLTGSKDSPVSYLVYLLSAYTLFIWCVLVPSVLAQVKGAIHSHPLGNRYLTDLSFRGQLSLYSSALISICYALFKLSAGIYYRSFWFGAIAIYYLILALSRVLLLHSIHKKQPDLRQEYKSVKKCGLLLFALNIALSAVTVQMVTGGMGYEYPGYLIFVMAGYSFYAISVAVVNLIRYRKLNSPVLSASKLLSLATAAVSMLSLQTAMFASFGGDFQFQRLMNALTGGAVCLLIFIMAILMVLSANKKIYEGGK